MRVDLFDFELPQEAIALRPVSPRDSARLLVVPPEGDFSDRTVLDLPRLLAPGDALVVNDTRVIHARLSGFRTRGESQACIEATLIERVGADRWRALVRPAKKLAVGESVRFDDALEARVVDKGEAGEILFAFPLAGAALDAAIEASGVMPLPPYIAGKRAADARDEADYQTLFAARAGAVAAPTAGLHFTARLLDALRERDVALHRVTLHVGAGTFLPVKAEDTQSHKMHAEWGALDAATAEALNATRARGGRVVAVGTTALRVLESAAREDGLLEPFAAETAIFITPGYRFRAVDALLTNFHLPRSTLFMLVCAFSGLERMQSAYAHALRSGYRFYSYGDACLLLR
ncbi:tRNA preQ1(34) S-adenosylmethionine ribosyltransferase-isomerase QueA [Methylosinus sp. Sm6]|uniref:tRNA preQ1(34) S-adenosylmethionine ribosyltransferase-isomerase QueA n=1 Tax=Methylosinus sp. Sm6 TaxID=2866948 RepID=UPI001C99A9D4|nr:tRNA preQ1(34) S-adenosylmethionine ribosyltransferase-isomerase QueA [Methylosinus sp. Sm6]MBY6240184.1 tRNA preQ1(34) S-adenosylmethionine ribosyltransferase-isomerase QueA [Methylosinus sp. Sm6]